MAVLPAESNIQMTDAGIVGKPDAGAGMSSRLTAAQVRDFAVVYSQAEVDALVTGLLDLQGSLDCSANPNYPSATLGHAYYCSVAGKVGGASGKTVEVGDLIVASATNAGGTEASVGTSWFVLQSNLIGALLSANNLSDLTSASTARTNLGLGSLATQSSVTASQISDSTSVGRSVLTAVDAAAARTAIGAGTSSFDGAFSSLSGKPTTLSGYGITDAQPLDSDLTAIAALTTVSFGRSLLTYSDAASVRTAIGAGTSSFDGAFSSLSGKPTTLSGYGITDAQPLDADLTAIAALTGTNNIYYRSAADTWSSVTIGSGLSFSGGTLSATSSGITTLNTLTGATQTFAVGASGSDFAISSSGTTHTFNLPDASATNRGAVTTGTQTIAGAKTFSHQVIAEVLVRHTETTSTPSGTTQTITLANGNHQTLTLTSSTGDVTVTLTVPSSSSAGTLIVKQHASTARNITWAVSAGSIKWCGTQPTWNADAVSATRLVSWRYDGSIMYLAATDVAA